MCVCRESRQWFSLMDAMGVRQVTDATQLELICRKEDKLMKNDLIIGKNY